MNIMDSRRPKTVKVTVYSARNLKPKKGNGDPLAWVVFGFGKEKCCTSQIRERNPQWNEESTFTIADAKTPLKFNIKDKDDIIGQILIPVEDIPSDMHFLKWVEIGPHRKYPNPSGEICIDCWVEEFYEDDELPKQSKFLFNKTLNRLTGRSPEPIRKFSPEFGKRSPLSDDRRFGVSSGVTSMKGSISIEDISGSSYKPKKNGSKFKDQSLLAPRAYTDMRKATSTFDISSKSDDSTYRRLSAADISTLGQLPPIKEQNFPPKITSFTPTKGPTSGGTLIQITGKHLGVSKEDINRLSVGGCNCIDSVEYYTPTKIMCTTGPSSGKGPITMSTRSGGMSSSKMMFEFLDNIIENGEEEATPSSEMNGLDATDSSRDSKNEETNWEDKLLIDNLKDEIKKLKYDNQELREYIDKLVLYLMDKYPDALESSKMYCRR